MALFSTIGNIIAGDKQADAIDRSSEISQQNFDQVLGYLNDTRGRNEQLFDPFVRGGVAAFNQRNAMLGLGPMEQGGPAAMQLPTQQPNALSQFVPAADRWGVGDGSGYSYGGPRNLEPQIPTMVSQIGNEATPVNRGQLYAMNQGRPTLPIAYQPQIQPEAAMSGGQTAQGAANDAFDIFRNSTNYQFRLGEGLDAVNSGYAGAGTLQSGAAMRGINDYAQNFASNELTNYMNMLGQQQSVGAGAASSVAGVNQNFASNLTNASTTNSLTQGNNALASGQASANMWGGIGNALGGGAGLLYGILG